jgi:hypothetical protein
MSCRCKKGIIYCDKKAVYPITNPIVCNRVFHKKVYKKKMYGGTFLDINYEDIIDYMLKMEIKINNEKKEAGSFEWVSVFKDLKYSDYKNYKKDNIWHEHFLDIVEGFHGKQLQTFIIILLIVAIQNRDIIKPMLNYIFHPDKYRRLNFLKYKEEKRTILEDIIDDQKIRYDVPQVREQKTVLPIENIKEFNDYILKEKINNEKRDEIFFIHIIFNGLKFIIKNLKDYPFGRQFNANFLQMNIKKNEETTREYLSGPIDGTYHILGEPYNRKILIFGDIHDSQTNKCKKGEEMEDFLKKTFDKTKEPIDLFLEINKSYIVHEESQNTLIRVGYAFRNNFKEGEKYNDYVRIHYTDNFRRDSIPKIFFWDQKKKPLDNMMEDYITRIQENLDELDILNKLTHQDDIYKYYMRKIANFFDKKNKKSYFKYEYINKKIGQKIISKIGDYLYNDHIKIFKSPFQYLIEKFAEIIETAKKEFGGITLRELLKMKPITRENVDKIYNFIQKRRYVEDPKLGETIFEYGRHLFPKFLSPFLDIYILGRMLKQYTNPPIKNIIIYVGYNHAERLREIIDILGADKNTVYQRKDFVSVDLRCSDMNKSISNIFSDSI